MKIIICGLLTIGLLVCLSTNVGEIPIDKKGMIEIKYVDVVNNKNVITEIEVNDKDCDEIGLSVLNIIGIKEQCIKDISVEDSTVIVDFLPNSIVLHSGTAGELAILDSLAMTFVECQGYDNIIFRVDGKPYESGHIAFGIDEVYY